MAMRQNEASLDTDYLVYRRSFASITKAGLAKQASTFCPFDLFIAYFPK